MVFLRKLMSFLSCVMLKLPSSSSPLVAVSMSTPTTGTLLLHLLDLCFLGLLLLQENLS
ncbi:hypothetical protein F2Q70_00044109 [Brassica cretica]|uniref:Uncharacterized protein n=1 Tax=Brassica cretica TaxID=69181 RepID=A0A8S9KJZ5_BRACR|nr:hypothetical protein F2Q70_00044109 [Brassica cretica]